ncbi:MAG TPA: hypothetical protein VMV10_21095, partial [Pirellulales bacterium]|nr:hypothetical protein [Pirellulales bacterium]
PAAASFEAVDGRLIWSEAPVDATADEFIAPLSRRLEARHERETAACWLLDALAGGPIESRELFRQARDCGISTRTLRRAAQSLGLSPHKAGFRGPWQWSLGEPEHDRRRGIPAALESGKDAASTLESGEPEASASGFAGAATTLDDTEAHASGSPGADRRHSLRESTSFRGAKSDHGRGAATTLDDTEADASGSPDAESDHGRGAASQAETSRCQDGQPRDAALATEDAMHGAETCENCGQPALTLAG